MISTRCVSSCGAGSGFPRLVACWSGFDATAVSSSLGSPSSCDHYHSLGGLVRSLSMVFLGLFLFDINSRQLVIALQNCDRFRGNLFISWWCGLWNFHCFSGGCSRECLPVTCRWWNSDSHSPWGFNLHGWFRGDLLTGVPDNTRSLHRLECDHLCREVIVLGGCALWWTNVECGCDAVWGC